MEKKYIQELEDNGMKVIENPDLEPFKAAVESVYEKYEPQFGKELIDEIRNTQ
jgi:TRAP-type transport system periplasmic protein